jgi:hypothetical protein
MWMNRVLVTDPRENSSVVKVGDPSTSQASQDVYWTEVIYLLCQEFLDSFNINKIIPRNTSTNEFRRTKIRSKIELLSIICYLQDRVLCVLKSNYGTRTELGCKLL